ncbi:MAG: ATP-binding protein [Bdellovibrionaceae bacterium]|nr:ATP-binding protein [Pseudobdellovibrionaceae bacterium]
MSLFRLASDDLKKWFAGKMRKPLVIRGARQVGKSTLVQNFAIESKLDLLEINFEIKSLKSLEARTLNPESLFLEIEALFDQKLSESTLIFFDEIQKQPAILPALRYFREKLPNVPIIAAGSLLEFVLKKHDFDMPVGRIEYLHLGPLTFSEFLFARKKKLLWSQVGDSFDRNLPLTIAQHEQMNEAFREYIFVGGMPEAVSTFISTKDPKEVRRVHASIVETYRDDFPKYANQTATNYLGAVFEKLPQTLGRKVKYASLSQDFQSRDIKMAIELLCLARVVLPCYHSNGSGLPLAAQKDPSVFKLYFLDVGLYNFLMGITWMQAQDYHNDSILTKGIIAEQFIAQHLAYHKGRNFAPSLFYWLRDKKSDNAELDFVTDWEGTVVPIEVKAGQAGTLKSLIQFVYEKKVTRAVRLDLKQRDFAVEDVVYNYRNAGKIHKVKFDLFNLHLGLIEKVTNDI